MPNTSAPLYVVRFEARAEKELATLDHAVKGRVGRALARLAADPFSAPNVKALVGGGYRLRVGDVRVLYEVRRNQLVVLVVAVGHRREVYR